MTPSRRLFAVLATVLALLLADSASLHAQPADPPAEEDVPYGVAAIWLYGRHLLADGDVEEALRNLHAVYRTHPEVPQVAWDFQAALVAGGFLNDALKILDDLVADHPDSAAFLLQRSDVLVKLGENGKALQDLRRARRAGSENLEVIMGEASILAAMGKTDRALDVCREGLDILPESGPRIYMTMFVILDQADRQEDLPGLIDEGIGRYPDSTQLHEVRLRSLVALGRDDEALAAARDSDRHFAGPSPTEDDTDVFLDEDMPQLEAPSMEPTSFVLELADTYAQSGRPDRAIQILEPLRNRRELGREPSLWLARLYLGNGQQDKGLATVDSVLARWPRAGQAWFLKGRILEAEGRNAEALDYFSRGVALAPDDAQIRMGYVRGMLLGWENDLTVAHPDARQQAKRDTLTHHLDRAGQLVADADSENQLVLGYAYRAVGDLDSAVQAFGKAALLPELHRPASLQLSVCFDDLDQPQKSREILEDLRRLYPRDPEVANSLGYFLAEKGEDLDKAERLIREALDKEPGTGAFLDSMGWVLYRQGRLEEAFDYMIQAVNVLPEDPVILEHLGLVLRDMGQVAEAEEMLRRALRLGGDRERLQEHLDNLPSGSEGP